MGLVGVLAKAISPRELEMAASGGIPPRLGGGPVGSHGVERGVEGREGYGSVEPSRAYHRAMSGDLGVPKPDPLRPDEGHNDRLAELLTELEQAERRTRNVGGPPKPWEEEQRGGSLGRALRREHGGSRMFAQPPGGGMGRSMRGVQTADIEGAPEAAPWEREEGMSTDEPGITGTPRPEPSVPSIGPRGRGSGAVGVTEPKLSITGGADLPESLRGIDLSALPPAFRAKLPKIAASMADRPSGTGHRRQE